MRLERHGLTYEQFAELSPEQQQQVGMQINSISEGEIRCSLSCIA